MSDVVKEFFEHALAQVDGGRMGGMRGRYLFEVEPAGSWTVSVGDGDVVVTEGGDGDTCDCVIATSQQTFVEVASKRQSPMVAYMTGKLKVRGNMAAATRLLGEMKAQGLL